ncbi:hypothetical protein DSECCO2_253490 [anaerobic digester metagenome]
MRLKKNIYLVHTEYHLMLCLQIAHSYYSSEDFENCIHIDKIGERFKTIDISNCTGNIKIYIHNDISKSDLVRKLVSQNCCRFFFCQENDIYNRYLAFKLKTIFKVTICLVQDGYKPYVIFQKKNEFLSIIKDSFIDQKRLILSNLLIFKFFKSDYYRYGSTDFLDEVWLTNVDMFNSELNKCNAKLISIPPFNQMSIKVIGKYFRFSDKILNEKVGILFYLNQPFWTLELVDREISFLKKLVENFGKPIYLKLHPATSLESRRLYESINNMIIIDDKTPAEFYILEIKDSIIFSGWSSALITHNISCNYYFTLPIFRNCGAKSVDQSTLTIMPHIKLITEPKEMKFPK